MRRHIAFAVPGDLAVPTGGYAYDRRIIAELEQLGWRIDSINLGDGFPWPSEDTRAAAETRLLSVRENITIVIDGLAFGVLPDVASQLHVRHPLLALVHHPLALETALSPEQIVALRESERAALAVASRVVVTSATTARCLVHDYAVPAHHIAVIPPGIDATPFPRRNNKGVVHLLSIGSVIPRKGFDVLIVALATLTDLPWRLSIAGDCGRDPAAFAELRRAIARFGLGERVTLLGVVAPSDIGELFLSADLFVLGSRFEGYGMAYAEAIAHGLPVIGTTAGAIPETVPKGAGLLVTPGDAVELAQALRRLIAAPDERRKFAACARQAASQFPKWPDSGWKFAHALESIA